MKGALESFEAGDLEATLDVLVERWRQTRDSRLADVIERVSDRVPLKGLVGKTHAERQAHWKELWEEESSAELPRVLHGLRSFPATRMVVLLEELEHWPADPRIGRAVLDLIEHPPEGLGDASIGGRFSGHCEHLLIESLDAAQHDRAERIGRRDDVYMGVYFHNFERNLASRARPLAPGEDAILDALEAALEREVPTDPAIDALYAAVYAAPDDDAARLVLADALLERDDPHGTFISLQLRPTRGTKSRARRLEQELGPLWVGPLARAVTDVKFSRGFPATGRVMMSQALPLASAPEWATFCTLDTGADDPAPLLETAPLTALTALSVSRRDIYETITARYPHLKMVS